LSAYEDLTFIQMRNLLADQEEQLVGMYRFCTLSIYFLKHCAEPMARELTQASMFDCFPSAVDFEKHSYIKTIGLLTCLKAASYVTACGVDAVRHIDTVIKFVENLKGGQPPTEHHIVKMSDLFKAILERCEHFCVSSVLKDTAKGSVVSLFAPRRQVSGKDAMSQLWAEFELKDPKSTVLDDVDMFRRFLWMLSPQRQQAVSLVVSREVHSYQTTFGASFGVLCDAPTADKSDVGSSTALVLKSPLGAASSSSSCAPAATKKDVKQVESMADQKAQLLSLYRR
jgi:hypothetical protein